MSHPASFEGGINTMQRAFPAGVLGNHTIGVMPKNGKVVRARIHGRGVETLASVRLFRRTPTSAFPFTPITAVSFATQNEAFGGFEFALEDPEARELSENDNITVSISGTSSDEIVISVSFAPRPPAPRL